MLATICVICYLWQLTGGLIGDGTGSHAALLIGASYHEVTTGLVDRGLKESLSGKGTTQGDSADARAKRAHNLLGDGGRHKLPGIPARRFLK